MRWFTNYFLPAFGTLYLTLATIWNWPYGEQLTGTVTGLILFMNAVLGLSKAQYERQGKNIDGVLEVQEGDVTDTWTFNATKPLDEIAHKKEVTFKVQSH